jgi:DUF5010 C-terminal domain
VGGDGVGYHDTTSGNDGGQFRSDDVDVQVTTDVGGGYNVGWIDPGEWLAFDVTVAQSGSYDIRARVASAVARNKSLHVAVDGGWGGCERPPELQRWVMVAVLGRCDGSGSAVERRSA